MKLLIGIAVPAVTVAVFAAALLLIGPQPAAAEDEAGIYCQQFAANAGLAGYYPVTTRKLEDGSYAVQLSTLDGQQRKLCQTAKQPSGSWQLVSL